MQALLNVPKINPKCFDRNYKWPCFVNLCSLQFDYVSCRSLARVIIIDLLSRRYVNKLVNQIELCIATNVGQIFGFSLGFLVTLPKSAKRCPRPFSCGQ